MSFSIEANAQDLQSVENQLTILAGETFSPKQKEALEKVARNWDRADNLSAKQNKKLDKEEKKIVGKLKKQFKNDPVKAAAIFQIYEIVQRHPNDALNGQFRDMIGRSVANFTVAQGKKHK